MYSGRFVLSEDLQRKVGVLHESEPQKIGDALRSVNVAVKQIEMVFAVLGKNKIEANFGMNMNVNKVDVSISVSGLLSKEVKKEIKDVLPSGAKIADDYVTFEVS